MSENAAILLQLWLVGCVLIVAGFAWAKRQRLASECREDGHQWVSRDGESIFCRRCGDVPT